MGAATRTWLLGLSVLLASPALPALAQGASPTHLDDLGDDPGFTEIDSDGLGPSYRDLLAAGYLLGIPAATATAGVGLLLPVGVHYARDNPAGGNRAMLGILGGLVLGGALGGLVDQPQDGFAFTTGMLYGMLSGYLGWGAIDIGFFAERPRPRSLSAARLQRPQAW